MGFMLSMEDFHKSHKQKELNFLNNRIMKYKIFKNLEKDRKKKKWRKMRVQWGLYEKHRVQLIPIEKKNSILLRRKFVRDK